MVASPSPPMHRFQTMMSMRSDSARPKPGAARNAETASSAPTADPPSVLNSCADSGCGPAPALPAKTTTETTSPLTLISFKPTRDISQSLYQKAAMAGFFKAACPCGSTALLPGLRSLPKWMCTPIHKVPSLPKRTWKLLHSHATIFPPAWNLHAFLSAPTVENLLSFFPASSAPASCYGPESSTFFFQCCKTIACKLNESPSQPPNSFQNPFPPSSRDSQHSKKLHLLPRAPRENPCLPLFHTGPLTSCRSPGTMMPL